MIADYFDPAEWNEQVVKRAGKEAPAWLAEALKVIGENEAAFPPAEDADRFVDEFVYPH